MMIRVRCSTAATDDVAAATTVDADAAAINDDATISHMFGFLLKGA